MSSPKQRQLTLSPRAHQDFIDILRFTGETWGPDPLQTYGDKINDALHAIGENLQLGHLRDDLPPTHLAYLVGSHIIIYRVRGDAVAVVRILHQRMSPAKHV